MSSPMPKSDSVLIRDVWAENLKTEIEIISDVVDKYNYVAMDTEFPGVVLNPLGVFKSFTDRYYFQLKVNANMMKLIQLGLTFTDKNGNLPTCKTTGKYCVWQFNFREFDHEVDICASDSVKLLRNSGIDFVKNKEKGVDSARFAELLMPSGVVLNHNVQWVTFQGGYDFGYLLKLLKGKDLPETQVEFFELIKLLFPTSYDVKHLMKFTSDLHGGLDKVAQALGVERVGICHQAGSDSLLTSFTFRKLTERYFRGSVEQYSGYVHNLGVEN